MMRAFVCPSRTPEPLGDTRVLWGASDAAPGVRRTGGESSTVWPHARSRLSGIVATRKRPAARCLKMSQVYQLRRMSAAASSECQLFRCLW